jgi:hypothetical protein
MTTKLVKVKTMDAMMNGLEGLEYDEAAPLMSRIIKYNPERVSGKMQELEVYVDKVGVHLLFALDNSGETIREFIFDAKYEMGIVIGNGLPDTLTFFQITALGFYRLM